MRAHTIVTKKYRTEIEVTSDIKTVNLASGQYLIEMYGAGGGSYSWSYQKAWGTNGGGSGAGFKGVIEIPEGEYVITVGKYNGGTTKGGSTTFGSLIICEGGGYETYGYGQNPKGYCTSYGDGGKLTINEGIILSYEIKSDGIDGASYSYDGGGNYFGRNPGGFSVYDESINGYGAGQYANRDGSATGKDGYFKLTALTENTGEIYYQKETKLTSKTERKYYKYEDEPWVQPVLTANGTMGGDSFAVSATNNNEGEPYRMFDGDTSSSYYCQCRAESGTITFYNPQKICVTNINITGWTDSNWQVKNCVLSGSNDGISWEQISTYNDAFISYNWALSNTNYYKYYKIDWVRNGSYGLLWREITLTATVEIVEESTEQDYDFYIDSNKYLAIKSYERGQYYGGNA